MTKSKNAKIINYDYNNYEYEIIKISHERKPFRENRKYSFKEMWDFEFNPRYTLVKILSVMFTIVLMISVIGNVIFFGLAYGYGTSSKLGINGVALTLVSHAYDPDARSLAVNITRGCSDDMKCNFRKIVDYVNDFDYVVDGNLNSRIYPINQTIKDKAGECEGLSYLFNSLYSEVGGNVVIWCGDCHCVSIVIFDEPEYQKFIYDPTSKMVYMYDEWYMDAFNRMCQD